MGSNLPFSSFADLAKHRTSWKLADLFVVFLDIFGAIIICAIVTASFSLAIGLTLGLLNVIRGIYV